MANQAVNTRITSAVQVSPARRSLFVLLVCMLDTVIIGVAAHITSGLLHPCAKKKRVSNDLIGLSHKGGRSNTPHNSFGFFRNRTYRGYRTEVCGCDVEPKYLI